MDFKTEQKVKLPEIKPESVDTHITVILDKSGSMESVRRDTIDGFNSFLSRHKEANTGKKVTLSLVEFSDNVEMVYKNRDILEAPQLSWETFRPHGWTALLDAMGYTFDASIILPPNAKKVLFAIITDGGENTSRRYTRDTVTSLIRQLGDLLWDVVFIGANMDAIAEGASFGIPMQKSFTWTQNAAGLSGMTTSLYNYTANTVSANSAQASVTNSFTEADRKAQEEAQGQPKVSSTNI